MPRKIARGSSYYEANINPWGGLSVKPIKKEKVTITELHQQRQQLLEQIKEFDVNAQPIKEYKLLCAALDECCKNCSEFEAKLKIKKAKQSKAKRAEGYTLNKSKVRDKCTAFFNLEKSRKFCAFYSVSFPKGCSEDDIFRVWNAWLTNLRKTYGLADYIWVAEYQKNGTLHFHMLTNTYMRIQRVNKAMALCLFRNGMLGNVTIDKYNGVDVKKVHGNVNNLNSYLTKYISKSETHEYKRAPWHCSRSVSALFTSIRVGDDNDKLQNELVKLPCRVIENDFAIIEYFNVKDTNGRWYNLPAKLTAKIQRLNEKVYNLVTLERLQKQINELTNRINNAKSETSKRKYKLYLYNLNKQYEKIYSNSFFSGSPTREISECDKAGQLGQMVQLSLFTGNSN